MRPGMFIRMTGRIAHQDIVTAVDADSFTIQPDLKGGCVVHPGGWSLPRIRHGAHVAAGYEPVTDARDAEICTAPHGKGAHIRREDCPD
jgi:hypothetical protein